MKDRIIDSCRANPAVSERRAAGWARGRGRRAGNTAIGWVGVGMDIAGSLLRRFRPGKQTGLSSCLDFEQTGRYSQGQMSPKTTGPKLEGSAHDRLLAAANELFYEEGVNTVGIERVIERAGVA